MRVDGIPKGLNPIFCSITTECPVKALDLSQNLLFFDRYPQ
jgi:hypothetical protein